MTRKEKILWYQKMDARGAMDFVNRWKYTALVFRPVYVFIMLAMIGLAFYKGRSAGQAMLILVVMTIYAAVFVLVCAIAQKVFNMDSIWGIILGGAVMISMLFVMSLGVVAAFTVCGIFS